MRRTRLALLLVLGMVAALLPMGIAPAAATGNLVISGVVDGPVTGGIPKAVEFYVTADVADLSIYGVGSANNGGGTDGEEFTFPAGSATAGDFIYVASEAVEFGNFFGFAPDYTDSVANVNGDDAIELFQGGVVVDVFGDINVDGTGEPWDSVDGWAYRVNDTGPDGSTFVLANWTFSGVDALDGEATNATATTPFPIGTYTGTAADSAPSVASSAPADGATGVAVDSNVEISFSEDVVVAGAWYGLSCTASGAVSATVSGGPASYTLDPAADLANDESCTVTVLAAQVSDVDTDDPPDNMGSDYSFTFTVAGVPAASPAIINEMLADPAGDLTGDANGDGTRDATQDEFVEIANDSASPLDLSGWTLSDAFSVRHTFPTGSTVPAMCSIVVFGGGTPTGEFGNAVVQTASSGALGLNNGGDTVTLSDGVGDVLVETYGSEGGGDESLTRDPDISGPFVKHSTATDSGGALFSPGTTVDGTLFAGCESSGPADVVINEVDADTVGTDVLEFVELFDGGSGTTALDGLVVVFYNGNDDLVYDAFDLDGFSTDADGYFTLGNAGVVPTPSITFGSNGLQNGPDAVGLYSGDATDFPNGTALTTTDLVDAMVYDTDDADDAELLVLLNAGQPQVNEGGGGDKDSQSNQRCPDGTGGERNTDTYAQYLPTPGAANTCAAPATPVKIHDVQGNGSASPIVGQAVEVEGVVVGDFQGSAGLGGFFLQEEDADFDADPATSEGVFVYQGDTFDDVAVGDVVNVVGTVSESFGQTQIGSVTAVTVTSAGTGVASTATVSMPVASPDVWESHEGMLLTIPQTLYVSSVYALGRYGEVELAVGAPLDNPTNVVAPGAAANAFQAANDLARIQLDDGSSWSNVDPTPYLTADGTLRNGDSTVYLTGVLGYGFGKYEIQPTSAVVFDQTNPRPAGSPAVGGTLTVASFNVLNYFTTIDTGTPICGPSGTLGCRGADTAEEFTLQRTKIVNAIAKLDADVVGLMEIENHATDDALKDLVAGLNAKMGAGTYAYVATGPVGDDAIKVALIYKPASVTPSGAFAILDSSVDPTFIEEKNRPVVAQTFMEISSDEYFTTAVNHLKSKGSDCDALGDPDMGDGQGNCNLTRTSAATAMVNWLASDPTASGDDDVLIIGDLNSYAMEDPIAAVTGAGYSDLIAAFEGIGVVSSAYSYEFGAQLGYLDHALSSSTLTPQVAGAAFWHINADEPTALDYQEWNLPANQTTDEFKSSDHDPVVIGLALDTVIVEPPDPVIDYFTDDDDSVFERDINAIAAIGITNGCNPPINDEYCPDRFVTRGEFASLMARTRGLTVRSDNPFIDDDDSIFEADIERIHAAGITKGCNPPLNDEFCEERTLTRGEAAAMFVRAFGYTDDGGGNLFIDDDDSVFEGDIDRLATVGITLGCNPAEGNTKFCPNRSVTRGEVAAFIARALGI